MHKYKMNAKTKESGKSGGLFKRIVKIFAIVFLCGVLVVGLVAAYLGITGAFKKKVVKPTAIAFAGNTSSADGVIAPNIVNGTMNLVYDVSVSEDEQIFSFVISAQPLDVTETECTIRLSNSTLITFKRKVDGKWEDYTSNVFYLNQPIYFAVNNITDENSQDYNNGILTLTVEDKSGLLKTSMTMEIDRVITSISINDIYTPSNNNISNGLFSYEISENNVGEENGTTEGNNAETKTVTQTLESVVNQDYPLEIISAPLMALKPFANKDAKVYEIYYVEAGQPKLLTHEEGSEIVRLEVTNDKGDKEYQTCSFLKYDLESEQYVLNSEISNTYEFKLAAYRTYADQERYEAQTDLILSERLSYMLQKRVLITVSGTDADNINFFGNDTNLSLNLFQDNYFVLNDVDSNEYTNLGLVLSKDSGAEIATRYNDVKFLDSSAFIKNNLEWVLKDNRTGGEVKIRFYEDLTYGSKRASVTGMSTYGIDETIEFSALLKKDVDYYTLELNGKRTDGKEVSIKFNLTVDSGSEKMLTLATQEINIGGDVNNKQTTHMTIDGGAVEAYQSLYQGVTFVSGNRLILDGLREAQPTDEENGITGDIYKFKALQSGIYLVMLGREDENDLFKDISDKFKMSISDNIDNPSQRVVNIMPIDDIEQKILYAIVVNSDGYYAYSQNTAYYVNINTQSSTVQVAGQDQTGVGKYSLPVIVGDSINYGSEIDVRDLAWVTQGSYTTEQILMFAPKMQYIKLEGEPADWEYNYYSYFARTQTGYSQVVGEGSAPIFSEGEYYSRVYYNYKFIDAISYVENGVSYYLLGYINDAGNFVNKVVPTGMNVGTRLYPLVIKTKYLSEYNRLQTATEYITELLFNADDRSSLVNATIDGDETRITYSKTLLPGSKIYNYVYNENSGEYEEDSSCYYKVTEVVYGSANITFITQKIIDGENAGNASVEFVIDVSIHDGEKIDIESNYFEPNTSYVVATSYYDFADTNSTKKPEVQFAGDYFDLEDAIDNNNDTDSTNDKYYIIVDHTNIGLNKDGGTATEGNKAIKDYTAKTQLTLNAGDANDILEYSLKYFTLIAKEYDENNQIVKTNSDAINFGNIQFVDGEFENAGDSGDYSSTTTYYTNQNGKYSQKNPTLSDIEDWENKKSNYYIATTLAKLEAEFTATHTLEEGHYIKITWVYNIGRTYEIQSNKLYIKSREIQGYTIDLGGDCYVATLSTLTSEIIDNWESQYVNYYQFNGEMFIQATENYIEDAVYYQLNTTDVYEGDIYYQIVVGYDSIKLDYTYKVYAMDESGNYLYTQITGDGVTYKAVSTTLDDAFSIDGWISVNPFYAEDAEYNIIGDNDYLTFDGENNPTILQISGDYFNVTIQNRILPTKTTTINVKIVQDGNFVYNIAPSTTSSAKEQPVQTIYTYRGENDVDIADKLNATITNLVVKNINGEEITSEYTRVNDRLYVHSSETIEEGKTTYNDYIELSYNTGWTVARGEFVNVEMTIVFKGLLGSRECTFSFTNPYKIIKSTKNTTETIYSGTTFVLAEVVGSDATPNDNYLYSLQDFGQDASFRIDYRKVGDTTYSSIDVQDHLIYFTVPDVTEPTEYEFAIVYTYGDNQSDEVDTFKLKVAPNYIMTGASNVEELNDDYAKEYNLSELAIKKYDTTIQYAEYSSGSLQDVTDTVTYTYEIFTDSEYKNKYNVNIVSVVDATNGDVDVYKKLVVNAPISEVGTYYVTLKASTSTNIGDTEVGVVNFIVSSKYNTQASELSIEAMQDTTYTLAELQEIYSLIKNGEMFVSTNTFVEGKTYKKVGDNYVLMKTDEGSGYYQKCGELTDILWLEYLDSNLEVTYNYETETIEIKQTKDAIVYNYKTYSKIGTSYNFDGLTYNAYTDSLTNASGVVTFDPLGNNVIYTSNAIYCKQNAYVFECDNEIIVISAESDGKHIYIFTKDENGIYLQEDNTKILSELTSLTFNYTSFGSQVVENPNSVAQLEYSAELMFNIDGTNHNIIGKNQYLINVKPHKLQVDESAKTIISGMEYVLYDSAENATDKGIFNITNDENIKSILLTSNDLTITRSGTKQLVFANANGNSYVADVTVELTYTDNTTYSYTDTITVVNKLAVGIEYAFNVDEDKGNAFATFNANVTEITSDAKGASYDATDLKKWLGADTFKFDLALKGDVIDLSQDNFLNIIRYSAYERVTGNITHLTGNITQLTGTKPTYESGRYYKYANGKYTLVESENAPEDWESSNDYYNSNYQSDKYYKYENGEYTLVGGQEIPEDWITSINYYTKLDTTTPAKIELEAVSNTLANTLQDVKANINIAGSKIAITNNFALTGYVVFKVYYSNDTTSPYGYYIVKVVDDNNFTPAQSGTEEQRYSQTITQQINDDGNNELLNIIRNSGYDISTVANISNYLIDKANIYLFMVDNYDNMGNRDTTIIGQLISNEQIINSTINTYTIKVAVVLKYGTSLVHLCNYEIIVKSSVTVTPNNTYIAETENDNYNIYKAKDLAYAYGTDNDIELANCLTVTENGEGKALLSVAFDTTKPYTSGLTLDGTSLKLDDKEIATIGTALTLTTAVSEQVEFYLSLTYKNPEDSESFVAYLHITLKPYSMPSGTVIDVGGYDTDTNNFVNTLETSRLVGAYDGTKTLEYSLLKDGTYTEITSDTERVKIVGTYLEFTQTSSQQVVYVKVTLSDIAPVLIKIYQINIAPNIKATYNLGENEQGRYQDRPLEATIETQGSTLTNIGSSLNVVISGNTLTIKDATETTYLTVNVGEFGRAEFNLYKGDANANMYFSNNVAQTLTESGTLNFVHSASDVDLRLVITIYSSATPRVERLNGKPADWDANYSTYYIEKDGGYILNTSSRYNESTIYYYGTDAYAPVTMYITLPKTYELTPVYRVENATYETIVQSKSLSLLSNLVTEKPGDWDENENYTKYYVKDADGQYVLNTNLNWDENISYYYAPDSLSNYLFGTETIIVNDVHKSRFEIVWLGTDDEKGETDATENDKQYYGMYNFVALGLLNDKNPNYLVFTEDETSQDGCLAISNGYLNFLTEGYAIISMLNSTMTSEITYEFRVQTAEADFNNIIFNKDLLYIKDENYISTTNTQLNADNFVFATLPYNVTNADGQVAWVTTDNDNLKFEVSGNQIVVKENTLTENYNNITVNIITMNGVAKSITLIVTDYSAEYGYVDGRSSEELYANTDYHKFADNTVAGIPRMTLTNGSDNVLSATETEYEFIYLGSTLGVITSVYDGFEYTYPNNDISLIIYKNKSFNLLSVSDTTFVTMVFDIKYQDYIIGRAFYSIQIENDIVIGMNSLTSTNTIIDLYLGSDIYKHDYMLLTSKPSDWENNYTNYYKKSGNSYVKLSAGNAPLFISETYYSKAITTINLLQSQDGSKYNNVFITLERYSDGYTIANNKALYNGNTNETLKTQSTLSYDEVVNHLTFSIDENSVSESLRDKVEVTPYGQLKITGNSAGSFNLVVGSKTVIGYYETFIINVNPVYEVITKYDTSINNGSGSGYKTGETADLFATMDSGTDSNYAFNVYKEGYGIKDNAGTVLQSKYDATVTIQEQVFDSNTTINTIKSPDSWEGITSKTVTLKTDDEDDDKLIYSYTIPTVPYSKQSGNRDYYIVSVRLTITANGEESYYYANYRVYNTASITVNDYYNADNEDKVITYTEGAWTSGNTITIMDLDNTGMYSIVTPVLEDEFGKTGVTYYIKEVDGEGKYTGKYIEDKNPLFEPGKYYKLHDIIENISTTGDDDKNICAYVTCDGWSEPQSLKIKLSGTTVTGTLPRDMFVNSTKFTFILKDTSTGAVLIEEEWTIKSNNEITPYDTLPLRELFLTSEIGNQDYYYIDIVGILSTWNDGDALKFVGNANKAELTEGYEDGIKLPNGYALYQVTYSGTTSGSTVFKNESKRFVLVGNGKDVAMGFNFNGGNYYINLTVDQDNITNDGVARIDLSQFVKIYSYSENKFNYTLASTITIDEDDSKVEINEVNDNYYLDLPNVDTYNSNVMVSVTITANGVTRTINVYFRFVITASELATGADDKNLDYMVYNSTLAEITEDEMNNNTALKIELLSLIKFNSTSVASADYNKFSVSVKDATGYYDVTYTYSYSGVKYTRTLKVRATNS